MTEESALTGKTLTHYTVLERIGGGGMGIVYRARDQHLDRLVAIKILPHGALADEAARKRFRREALALSKLNHPSIATIFDFDSQDGLDFLVMEYVAGDPLEAKLEKGRVTEKDTARLGVELAEGLSAAHKQGVIHRDLKPGNLRLTVEGRLKILDFGLAKLVHSAGTEVEAATQSAVSTETAISGTLPYMAPEQWRAQRVDERTDIWAAGTVLYELATGRRAFDEGSGPQVAAAILTKAPARPCLINNHLSTGFETIVLKCLEKDPERRYQSARELAVDLRRLEIPSSESSPRSRRRMPARLWIATAVTALAAVTLALNLGGLRGRLLGGVRPGPVHSLAVLPLRNLSRDPSQEYFSDGMTEELIATLGKISALRVISRSSVMIFKDVKKPLGDIAKALEVDALIEGSVFRSGDRVRINAELVAPKPERQLWADSYERDARDVLAIQADVAQAIAHQIRVRLTPEEAGRITSPRPINPAAHEAYLRGRSLLLDRVDQSEYRTAARQFEAAIGIDSSYAAPWAGLADMYYLISNLYLPPHEAMPKADSMATRALRLDGTSAEAHATLGMIRSQYYEDWEGAENELRRSIQLNPSYATARLYHAIVLNETGRHQEALAEIQIAHRLDPESNYIAITEGNIYRCAGMADSAIARLRAVIARDAGNITAHVFLARCYESAGAYDAAIQEVRTALSLHVDSYALVTAVHIYATAGRLPEARAALDRLVELSRRGHVPAYYFAMAYAGLGDRNRAFDRIDEAYQNHDEDLNEIKVEPMMRSLRSDPRFAVLLRRLHLAP